MKLVKPSAGLIAEFKAVVGQLPLAQPRKMFGYDALFVNGNMAVGLWRNTCVVKVSETDQAKLIKRGDGEPFTPMKGRVMTGWVELSEELAHDPEELLAWSTRAVAFVATLPPKLARPSKKTVAKPLPARGLLVKKPPTKKPPTKKPPTKKPPTKKPPTKKPPTTKKKPSKKRFAG